MNLKAYAVQDDEHGVIEFATNSASARRNGGNELGCEWEGVQSCHRAPWADEFAEQGWVPAEVLLANGWWQTCGGCGDQVYDDAEDEDGTPKEAIFSGRHVWCCQSCKDAEEQEAREEAARKQAVIDTTLERWPEATITYASSHDRDRCVHFQFDGGSGQVTWQIGAETVSIIQADLHAWKAWDTRQMALSNRDSSI